MLIKLDSLSGLRDGRWFVKVLSDTVETLMSFTFLEKASVLIVLL